MLKQNKQVVPPVRTDSTLQNFSSIVQKNLEDLHQAAHVHQVVTSDPAANDGSVGDIYIVQKQTSAYLTVKTVNGWFAQKSSVLNVRDFGAYGDGSHDDSVAVQSAITASATGGVLYFPAGTYKMSVTIGNENISIIGDHLATKFVSVTTSLFALNYIGVFTAARRFIKDIWFIGSVTTGRGLYLNNMGFMDLIDCRWEDLEYGAYCNATEWNTWTRVHFRGNKYGLVFVTKNGDVLGKNPTQIPQNSMEQYLFQPDIWGNTIGIYFDNVDDIYGDKNAFMSIYSGTFLRNDLGIATGAGGVETGLPSLHLYDCWFEVNGASGTQSFNGFTLNNGDISLHNTAALIENTLFETRISITGTSRVNGSNNRFLNGGELTFNIDSTVYVNFLNSIADDNGGSDITWAESTDILPLGPDRPVITRVPPRTSFVMNMADQNVLASGPSTCSTGVLPTIYAGTPTRSSVYGDGLYGNACVEISGVATDAVYWQAPTQTDYWYVTTFSAKSVSGAKEINTHLVGQSILPNATLKIDENWRTFASLGQSSTSGTASIVIELNGTMDFLLSCIQVVEFQNQLDAMAFLHSQIFVVQNSEVPNRMLEASSAPATGTWKRADIVWNSAPSSAGFVGWVCTSAGSPGTWKTFGLIS